MNLFNKTTMQYILPSLAGMVNGIGASQGREANGLELIIFGVPVFFAVCQSMDQAYHQLDSEDPLWGRKFSQETAKGGIIASCTAALGYGFGYLIGSFYQ